MDGKLVLGIVTLMVIGDMLIAIKFRQLADRADSGEAAMPGKVDASGARMIATSLLIMGPLLWLAIALMCFGLIPSGIAPIKF
jgi:hypothetical protein